MRKMRASLTIVQSRAPLCVRLSYLTPAVASAKRIGIMTIPSSRGWLNVLRFGLLVSFVGWGISFYFTFASWPAAAAQLDGMGAGPIEYRPLLDYWLRMASAVFGCVGLASLAAFFQPHAFVGLIRLLGPFHLVIGATLTAAAIRNHLTPDLHPTFLADITFCFLTALLILLPLLRMARPVNIA